MTQSIIATLQGLSDQTPDQIVERLTKKGWRKPSEIGREYFRQHYNTTPHRWCCVFADGDRSNVSSSSTWLFSHCANDYRSFVQILETSYHTYWLIPEDEFTGELPPCTHT